MSETLTFRGRLSLEDALDMQRYRSLIALRRPFRFLIAFVAVPVALLSLHDLYSYGLVAGNSFGLTPICFLLLSLYAAGGWSFVHRLNVRRYYRRNPGRFLETEVMLDEDAVRFRNANVDSRLAWSLIDKIVDTPKGLLFLAPGFQPILWLPLRAFAIPNSKDRVVCLAAKHAVAVRKAA